MKIFFTFIIVFLISTSAFAESPQINEDIKKRKHTTLSGSIEKTKDEALLKGGFWEFIKGEPSTDALIVGMFSYHTMEIKDQLNESNKLLGIDYNGYSIGTFNNSYHVQTYYAGISRKVFKKELPLNSNIEFKYKILLLHGYERYEPDLFGITPNIVPMIGLNFKNFGIDFMISPGKTLTFATNFRINLPESLKK